MRLAEASQCESIPIENKHGLRWEKAKNRLPEWMVERIEGGSIFHREVPIYAQDLDWVMSGSDAGTRRSSRGLGNKCNDVSGNWFYLQMDITNLDYNYLTWSDHVLNRASW